MLLMPCTERKAASVKAEDEPFFAFELLVLYEKNPLKTCRKFVVGQSELGGARLKLKCGLCINSLLCAALKHAAGTHYAEGQV